MVFKLNRKIISKTFYKKKEETASPTGQAQASPTRSLLPAQVGLPPKP
jgi:hypothetical protein